MKLKTIQILSLIASIGTIVFFLWPKRQQQPASTKRNGGMSPFISPRINTPAAREETLAEVLKPETPSPAATTGGIQAPVSGQENAAPALSPFKGFGNPLSPKASQEKEPYKAPRFYE